MFFFLSFWEKLLKKSVICVNPEVGNSMGFGTEKLNTVHPKLGSQNEKREVGISETWKLESSQKCQ